MNDDALKEVAYLRGLEKAAEEAGLDKEAFFGTLGRVGKGIGSLLGFGGEAGSIGSKLYSPFRILGGVGRSPTSQAFQRSMASQTGGFGMLGGLMGAAGAEEGDRLSGFAKGFGLGAIGGAGFGYGGAAFQKAMGGLAKRRLAAAAKAGKAPGSFWTSVQQRTAPTKFIDGKMVKPEALPHAAGAFRGGMAGRLGAGALVGGFGVGTMGAGLLGSTALEHYGSKYIPGLSDASAPTGLAGAARGYARALHLSPTGGSMTRAAGSTPGTFRGTY